MSLSANHDIKTLISCVRSGDNAAFSELLILYTPMINKVISGFLNPSLLRDEAFSEACVALHRAAISYDISRSDEITFGLYARICVYRRVSDLAEKCIQKLPTVDVDVDRILSGENVESSLVGRERMSEYQKRARGVLSEYEYSVFMLYIYGYTTAEMSEKLGRSVKSIENAKLRMLRHLREASKMFSDV